MLTSHDLCMTLCHPTLLCRQEKTLPGVVMSSGGHVYKMLYQLADLDEPRSVVGRYRPIVILENLSDLTCRFFIYTCFKHF